MGDTTWTVTLQPGGYAVVCDPHVGGLMRADVLGRAHDEAGGAAHEEADRRQDPAHPCLGVVLRDAYLLERRLATLNWNLASANLTGPATVAEVHLGLPGRTGEAVIPLCKACPATAKGTANMPASALPPVLNGRTYVLVETTKNPDGELRGQLSVIGE